MALKDCFRMLAVRAQAAAESEAQAAAAAAAATAVPGSGAGSRSTAQGVAPAGSAEMGIQGRNNPCPVAGP